MLCLVKEKTVKQASTHRKMIKNVPSINANIGICETRKRGKGYET